MADLKISQLPVDTALTGGEIVPVVDTGTTPQNRRTTVGAIAALAPPTNLSYDPATRLLSSSTGADVPLPLAGATDPGLLTAAEKLLIESALQAGQAFPSIVDVRNASGATLTIGTPVYVPSPGSSGTRPLVVAADASLEPTAARSVGLMWATAGNNSDGKIITHGILSGVNTSTLTEGAAVWLSETTGQLTSTRPTQPAHGVFLGFCIKQGAGASGILYVNVINGQELDELHDVLITGAPPAAGAPRPALVRASTGLWVDSLLTPADVGAAAADDSRLTDSREWSATTISQAEAEAGTATTRRAFTAERVRQAIVAWWATVSSGYVTTGDSRLTDAREWSAATVSQAEAEAGTSTSRLAFTPQRVFQAIAAWWNASAAKTKLDGIATGATANSTDAQLRDRSTHTGTQAASTIAGLATVATSGAYGDLSGIPTVVTTSAAGLQPATSFGTITYATTTNLDMATRDGQTNTLTLTGDVTFTASNLANGRTTGVRIIAGAASRTLTFPVEWTFVGTKPASIPSGKTAKMSMECYGATDADVLIGISIQP